MKIGDLVRWAVDGHHFYGILGIVTAEPWCVEDNVGETSIRAEVLFVNHPFGTPEVVDVEDVELVNEGR